MSPPDISPAEFDTKKSAPSCQDGVSHTETKGYFLLSVIRQRETRQFPHEQSPQRTTMKLGGKGFGHDMPQYSQNSFQLGFIYMALTPNIDQALSGGCS